MKKTQMVDCFGNRIENGTYYEVIPIIADRATTSYFYRDLALAIAICKSCNKAGEKWLVKKCN